MFQKWAERKRKILLIVPASLRKQWFTELDEKFFIKSIILDEKSFDNSKKKGNINVFDRSNKFVYALIYLKRIAYVSKN